MRKALRYFFYAVIIAILIPIYVQVFKLINSMDYTWNNMGNNIMTLYIVVLLLFVSFWLFSALHLVKSFIETPNKVYYLSALARDVLISTKKSLFIIVIIVAFFAIMSIFLTELSIYAQQLFINLIELIALYVVVLITIRMIDRFERRPVTSLKKLETSTRES
jgi:hypothetical protein